MNKIITLILLCSINVYAQSSQWGLGFSTLNDYSFAGDIVFDNPIGLPNGTVTAPALYAILDPNTGAYWLGNDQFGVSAGGVNAQWISEGDGEVSIIFGANLVNNFTGVSSAGSAVISKSGIESGVSFGDAVVIYAGNTAADYGTYIVQTTASGTLTLDRVLSGTDSDLAINILADGIIIENGTNAAKGRILLPAGSAAFPSLGFREGNAGIRGLLTQLIFTSNGADRFLLAGALFSSNTASGAGMLNETTSITNPTLLPDRANVDNGLSATVGSDIVHVVAGGATIVSFVEAAADYVEHKVGTVYTPSADQPVVENGFIAIDNTIVRVLGSGASRVLANDPAIEDGISDGQIIILQGTSAFTLTINDAVNTALAGDVAVVLGVNDTIQLLWDEGASLWIEISRSNN